MNTPPVAGPTPSRGLPPSPGGSPPTGRAPLVGVLRSLAVVYVPQLAAFLLGPLAECRHGSLTYGKLFPVLPGLLPSVLFRNALGASEALLVPVAGLATVMVLAVTFALWRRGGRGGRAALLLVALASAANAAAVGHALRA